MKKIGDYLEIYDLITEVAAAPVEGRENRSLIRGFINVSTPVKVLYMASLELDDMEMIESFRMNIDPEEKQIALPEIAVINPIRSEDSNIGNYKYTLKIYASGGVVHEFTAQVRF